MSVVELTILYSSIQYNNSPVNNNHWTSPQASLSDVHRNPSVRCERSKVSQLGSVGQNIEEPTLHLWYNVPTGIHW